MLRQDLRALVARLRARNHITDEEFAAFRTLLSPTTLDFKEAKRRLQKRFPDRESFTAQEVLHECSV